MFLVSSFCSWSRQRATALFTALLKEDAVFKNSSHFSRAFAESKAALISPAVMRYCNPDAPSVLHTDFSGKGAGAVLAQRYEGKTMEHLVEYASRTLGKVNEIKP